MKRSPLKRKTRLRSVNRKRKGHRFPKMVDDGFRKFVRSQECAVYAAVMQQVGVWQFSRDHRCGFYVDRRNIEAAHVTPKARGTPDPGNLWPACPRHHDEQEGRTVEFEAKYGLSLTQIAGRLWAAYQSENGA